MATLLSYALSILATVGSLCVAVLLFAGRLQLREDVAQRVPLAVFALFVAAATALGLLWWGGYLARPLEAFSYPSQFVLFSALVAVLAVAVTWFFEASAWTALFCCTAGYVVQNFATGLSELISVLTGYASRADTTLSGQLAWFWLCMACFALVYLPFYRFFARNISREALEQVDDKRMLVLMLVVMLGVIGFDLVIKSLTDSGLSTAYAVALRMSHCLTCALTYWLDYELLLARRLEVEREATERVLVERERQYVQGRENINAINVHYHAIRQQIHDLGARMEDGAAGADAAANGDEAADALARAMAENRASLRELEQRMCVYDAIVHTKSEALDTVLTEKGLVCESLGITLSCVADGAALSFMAPADVYALFSNALDNAIRAVGEVEPERRNISVVVREAMGMVSVHIESYCAGEEALALDVHPVENTVERYGGTLSTLVQEGTLHVNALIPKA